MRLNGYRDLCYRESSAAGWWDGAVTTDTLGVKFALIHSEVSEAFEAFRKDAPDAHLPLRAGVEVELTDALIRIFDLAWRMGLDLDGAFAAKRAYNARRDDHKLENRNLPGGKKF